MDFTQYLNELCEISGVISSVIINKEMGITIKNSSSKITITEDLIRKKLAVLQQNLLEMKLKHFRFNIGKYSIYGYFEGDFLIVIFIEKHADLGAIKAIVDKVLNAILISF